MFAPPKVTLSVSMQPGNNYRAAATLLGDVSDPPPPTGPPQVDQTDADAMNQYGGGWSGYQVPVVWSKMLTVWRRVWLELDSMAAGSDLSFTGEIDAIYDNDPHPLDGKFEYDVPELDDNGRFEGGQVSIPSTGRVYTLIDNEDAVWDDYYYTEGLMNHADLGEVATVVDDDAFQLPRTPNANISVLNQKYKNCYVEFIEHEPARDSNTVFVATMPFDSHEIELKCTENQDLHPAPNFWTALVLSGYQGYNEGEEPPQNTSSVDLDPDYWYHVHGAHPDHTYWEVGDTAPVLGVTPVPPPAPAPNVTIIYQETLRDYIAQLGICMHFFSGHWRNQTHEFAEPRIIAHEIGHQFGIEDHTVASLVDEWTGSDDELFGNQIAQIRNSTEIGEE